MNNDNNVYNRSNVTSSYNIKLITTIFLVLSLSIVTFVMIRNNDGDYKSSFIAFAQIEKDKGI